MIVPLSLMWAFKPVREIAPEQGISELFASQVGQNGPAPVGGSGGWARFFRGVDWLLKACDNVGFRPLRSRAVAACRQAPSWNCRGAGPTRAALQCRRGAPRPAPAAAAALERRIR
jgi:hypothetical protein